jgi:hypothetical protein
MDFITSKLKLNVFSSLLKILLHNCITSYIAFVYNKNINTNYIKTIQFYVISKTDLRYL